MEGENGGHNGKEFNPGHVALVEAALFMTSRPLSMEELESITGLGKDEIEGIVGMLEELYGGEEHGIMVDRGGGFRLMVKPEYLGKVKNLSPYADLSRGLLRALALVAYNEPVRQSDIVKLIGNRAYEYIRELELRGLVRTEKASRTKIITTTENFERYFGISKEELRKMLGKEGEGRDADGDDVDSGSGHSDGEVTGEGDDRERGADG